MMLAQAILTVALAWASTLVHAQPSSRVALLIGNAAYAEGALRNPGNDVRAIESSIKQLGFTVTLRENLRQREMREVLRMFVLTNREAEVRLFYFAGHGLQLRGRNYLVPVDVKLNSEADILERTADATELIEQLTAIAAGANVIVIDACRTHPVFASGARRMWAAKPGLSPAQAPRGTLIAFSTGPGKVARDGAGPTSVYTRHLTQVMNDAPDLPMEVFFKRVRTGVAAETKNAQIPWDSSDITGELCFRPRTDGLCRQIE